LHKLIICNNTYLFCYCKFFYEKLSPYFDKYYVFNTIKFLKVMCFF